MHFMQRVAIVLLLAGASVALAACSNFDPDKLDIFGLNEKKKLPGERKELFPGGVPGVTQGIPPEYIRGNQPPPDAAQLQAPEPAKHTEETDSEADKKTTAAEPEPEPKPKPKPKKTPKPRSVAQHPVQAPSNQQQSQAPWPQQTEAQQSPSPWPTQGQTSTTAPWPSSPSPGTFSR